MQFSAQSISIFEIELIQNVSIDILSTKMATNEEDNMVLKSGKTISKANVGGNIIRGAAALERDIPNNTENDVNISIEDVPIPVTSQGGTSDIRGGEIGTMQNFMRRFEQMFIQHQMDVSQGTTEAVHSAIQVIRKDICCLSGRISTLEKQGSTTAEDTLGISHEESSNDQQARRPLFNETPVTPTFRSRLFSDSQYGKGSKRVRDWGLKYDGDPKSIAVERFLFRVETLQRKNGISSEELYTNFHLLLEKQAQEWFWLYMEEHAENGSHSFENFREAFVYQFRQTDCDEEIRTAINERKQGYNESFDEFYAAVRGLSFTMKTKLLEPDLVNIIRRNLRPRIKDLIFGCQIRTLDQLRMESRRAEKHLSGWEGKISNKKKVSELNFEMQDHEEEKEDICVEAFDRRPNRISHDAKQISSIKVERMSKCPCDSAFHKLACFKCNQTNLKCYLCEKCAAENKTRDGQAGVNRSNSTNPGEIPNQTKQ